MFIRGTWSPEHQVKLVHTPLPSPSPSVNCLCKNFCTHYVSNITFLVCSVQGSFSCASVVKRAHATHTPGPLNPLTRSISSPSPPPHTVTHLPQRATTTVAVPHYINIPPSKILIEYPSPYKHTRPSPYVQTYLTTNISKLIEQHIPFTTYHDQKTLPSPHLIR